MYGLSKMLKEESVRLKKIEKMVKEQLKEVPEGFLRLSNCAGHVQYYQCTRENYRSGGRYIHKSEEELACQLAQKGYDEKVLRLVEKRLRQIERLEKEYRDNELEQIFLKENAARQEMICPVEPIWEKKLGEWMQEDYTGKGFEEGTPVIYSDRGERVRSKSEKILADFFYHNSIPYKYEKPIRLEGYGVVYPDFTFLSKRTGREIYWEHEGRMDDPGYARKAVKKIESYEKNGIYVGDRLVLTFETETSVLNRQSIERNVKRYLI